MRATAETICSLENSRFRSSLDSLSTRRRHSVRSQAAARYKVSPAEIVAAASLPHAEEPRRRVEEDVVAKCIAAESMFTYLKLDPLKLDNKLITTTFPR